MQMMIETCVDIAGHIIADKGYRDAIVNFLKSDNDQ